MVTITGMTQPQGRHGRIKVTRTEYPSAPIVAGATTSVELPDFQRFEGESSLGYEEVYSIRGELPHGQWLHYPLRVHVSIEAGEFVAVQPQLAIMAFGESPTEAILNLREELVDHYLRLVEAGDRLGIQLARQRELLRKLFTDPDA
jgi:hypothetical protein